ncbi:MAG: Ig-like domain-containing protein [Clostridia bacterium]|nr:Ig-like domain-containing protein [Clostridia bacterium]
MKKNLAGILAGVMMATPYSTFAASEDAVGSFAVEGYKVNNEYIMKTVAGAVTNKTVDISFSEAVNENDLSKITFLKNNSLVETEKTLSADKKTVTVILPEQIDFLDNFDSFYKINIDSVADEAGEETVSASYKFECEKIFYDGFDYASETELRNVWEIKNTPSLEDGALILSGNGRIWPKAYADFLKQRNYYVEADVTQLNEPYASDENNFNFVFNFADNNSNGFDTNNSDNIFTGIGTNNISLSKSAVIAKRIDMLTGNVQTPTVNEDGSVTPVSSYFSGVGLTERPLHLRASYIDGVGELIADVLQDNDTYTGTRRSFIFEKESLNTQGAFGMYCGSYAKVKVDNYLVYKFNDISEEPDPTFDVLSYNVNNDYVLRMAEGVVKNKSITVDFSSAVDAQELNKISLYCMGQNVNVQKTVSDDGKRVTLALPNDYYFTDYLDKTYSLVVDGIKNSTGTLNASKEYKFKFETVFADDFNYTSESTLTGKWNTSRCSGELSNGKFIAGGQGGRFIPNNIADYVDESGYYVEADITMPETSLGNYNLFNIYLNAPMTDDGTIDRDSDKGVWGSVGINSVFGNIKPYDLQRIDMKTGASSAGSTFYSDEWFLGKDLHTRLYYADGKAEWVIEVMDSNFVNRRKFEYTQRTEGVALNDKGVFGISFGIAGVELDDFVVYKFADKTGTEEIVGVTNCSVQLKDIDLNAKTATAVITNTVDGKADGIIVAAVYSEYNKLLGTAVYENISVSPYETKEIPVEISDTTGIPTVMKVFYWNNLSNCMPIASAQ